MVYTFVRKFVLAFTEKPAFLKHIDGPKPEFNKELNEKVSLYQGDLTKLAIDVIVNAANSKLAGGGGGKNIFKFLSHTNISNYLTI